MQIFGQVWLWSLGSFLLGVLFTWLLLVRPMRKRVVELEETGSSQPREIKQPTRVAEPVGPPTGKEADRFLDDLFNTSKPPQAPQHPPAPVQQQPIRPPQLPPPPMPTSAQPGPTAPPELPPFAAQSGAPESPFAASAPPESPFAASAPPESPFAASAPPELPPFAAQSASAARPELPPLPDTVAGMLSPQPQQSFSSRLDPQAPPEPPIPDESETELSDAPFRNFTESTTVFVPPADLRVPDQPGTSGEDWFAKEEDPDPHLITDVEDDEQVDAQGTIFTQHTTPIPDEMIRSLDNEPQPEPEPVQHYEPPLPEPVQHYDPPLPEPVQQYDPPLPEPVQQYESPEPVQYEPPLPEPVQYDPPLPEPGQHIETPKLPEPEPVVPVEPGPTQRFEPVAPPTEQEAPDSSRSLFEPVVPVPDQHEEAAVSEDDFVPAGPFGPGSAMPLPGGGAPAPEFNVKASVTALRYCTEDNPQFDRIVAEVWFRSPSDAERVGFRVLS